VNGLGFSSNTKCIAKSGIPQTFAANGSSTVTVNDATVLSTSYIVLHVIVSQGQYAGGATVFSKSAGSFTVVNYHGADSSTYQYIVIN
jgi:hypothetical protein